MGHFVQGMQHPRIFGQGHIGQGRTNIAPTKRGLFTTVSQQVLALTGRFTLLIKENI
jgi:hypothetical protein